MTPESTIVLASEQAAIAKGNLAESKTVSSEKSLPNGEDKPVDETETDVEETETETPETEENEETEETEEELEAKAKEASKPKKKGGFQKRIDKLNTRLSAAEQQTEYWRQQALSAKPAPEAKVEAKPDLSKRPKADDFKTADEYQEALTDWKVDQRLAKKDQEERDTKIKTEFQSRIQKHNDRITALKSTKEDWGDIEDTFKIVPLSLTVQEAILDSDESAALVYELGKDRAELERICKLGAVAAAKAIGKIEAKLSKPSNPPEKKETKTAAPKPITPVRTKGASSVKGYKATMSQKEYESWRNEQLKRQVMKFPV